MQISLADGSAAQLHTHRARALFVLLLVNRGRTVHRETLCVQLWPNMDEGGARSHLRKALWRIRSAIDPADGGDPIVQISDYQVGLDSSRIEADCWRFSDTVGKLEIKRDEELTASDVERLVDALDLNQATFAAGLFDDWCLAHQELMRQERIDAMARIVNHYRGRGDWLQSVHWAQKVLALDPAREDLHYSIMVSRYSMGDRTSAMRQYRECERVLRSEFGIGPSAGLRALRDHIAETVVADDEAARRSAISFGKAVPAPRIADAHRGLDRIEG